MPVRFRTHHEHDCDADARRTFGYAPDGESCYYMHSYALPGLRSDDGEMFYEVVVYAEQVEAWRLGNARWLVRRATRSGEDCGGSRVEIGVFADCPR